MKNETCANPWDANQTHYESLAIKIWIAADDYSRPPLDKNSTGTQAGRLKSLTNEFIVIVFYTFCD